MSVTVTVEVDQGILRGRRVNSKSGGSLFSFQGVPYAKPPIGPLRFKVAEPPESWSGVRDALEEGSCCTQYNYDKKQWLGTEDCLYLNVYTPQLVTDILRPTMVFIHGGGFVFGSGGTEVYGPDYLVDDGVVLVTINYRLGVLGFLCLDDPAAPGNVGLKDQVAALRWVQKNIANFGGDPDNVTIFGESAGGASVHFHMLSPMSKGLFSRAIAQSGCSLNIWALERRPREMAFRVGQALGFQGTEAEELVEFLRGINHVTLFKAARNHGLTKANKERLAAIPFVPTLEIEVVGVERFLPASPRQLVDEGQFHDVPYMTGVTSREGLMFTKSKDLSDAETLAKTDRDFNRLVLPEIRLPDDYSKTNEVVTKLRDFYLEGKPLNSDNASGFVDLYSDLVFTEGIHHTVKKMSQFNKEPVYSYMFSFDGELNYFKSGLKTFFPGASHVDDLGYLFRVQEADLDLHPDSPAAVTRSRVVRMWTNFARTGNPTPDDDPLLPLRWEPFSATKPCFLDIDEELALKENMFEERMEFWEELRTNL